MHKYIYLWYTLHWQIHVLVGKDWRMLLAAVVCVVLGASLVLTALWARRMAEVDLSTNKGTRIHRKSPRKITVIPRTEWQQRVRSVEVHNPPPRYGRHSAEHLLTDTMEIVGLPDLLRRFDAVNIPKIVIPSVGRYFRLPTEHDSLSGHV